MVRVSILYPSAPGARFDFRHYVETHMPMSIRLLSAHAGFRGVSVERGLSGASAGSPPTFIAMCHFLFVSAEDFLAAFMPHAQVLQGDMPGYTDIEPVIQFNQVLIARQLNTDAGSLSQPGYGTLVPSVSWNSRDS